jgi:N-dimethylarginine dimethylaminohydrolase
MNRKSNAPPNYSGVQHAEFAVVPEAFVVHDPVAVGAFEAMKGINDPALLERGFLFRELPNTHLYAEHHRAFVGLLKRHAKKVIYLQDLVGDHASFEAARTNPNQVFTRDALITIPWVPGGYIAARMKRSLRRSESDTMVNAAKRLGLHEIVRVPPHLFLEGGDVIPFSRHGRRTLLVGSGRRTGLETLCFLQGALIPRYADEIIGIELEAWRMNLDGGLLPVADDVVVADTRSVIGGLLLDGNGQRKIDVLGMLRDLGMRIIDVTPDESVYCQACNCVCLGGRRVIYYDLSDRIKGLLCRHDIEPYCIAGSELVKGRGGPRCMSRPIYKPL